MIETKNEKNLCTIYGDSCKGVCCFDFDGVICVHGSKDYSKAIPYQHAIDNINTLYARNWYIVIFTARYMARCRGNMQEAQALGTQEGLLYLRKFGVNFHEFIVGKPSAHIYVDDRACRVESAKGLEDWNNNFWPLANKIEEQNALLRLRV